MNKEEKKLEKIKQTLDAMDSLLEDRTSIVFNAAVLSNAVDSIKNILKED